MSRRGGNRAVILWSGRRPGPAAPPPGGGDGGPALPPAAESTTPSEVVAGSGIITLTVHGNGFTSDSVAYSVENAGGPSEGYLDTTFISDVVVEAQYPVPPAATLDRIAVVLPGGSSNQFAWLMVTAPAQEVAP